MIPEFEATGWFRVILTLGLMILGVWKAIDILIWYSTF